MIQINKLNKTTCLFYKEKFKTLLKLRTNVLVLVFVLSPCEEFGVSTLSRVGTIGRKITEIITTRYLLDYISADFQHSRTHGFGVLIQAYMCHSSYLFHLLQVLRVLE